jgi:hypothetical protein
MFYPQKLTASVWFLMLPDVHCPIPVIESYVQGQEEDEKKRVKEVD